MTEELKAGLGKMRRLYAGILSGILALCLWGFGSASAADTPRKLTIMVYMCGSNLESQYGSATEDLQEMMGAGEIGQDVSVLVMAGGSRTGNGPGFFQPAATTIHEIGMGRSRSIWSSGEPLDMGDARTLTELIRFAQEKRPAERYALILWNHGGGPLEGVCWDELFSMDQLSLRELIQALEDAGMTQKLSWIGFDACLMGSAEVALAMSPYAEYMIASQEREPAEGWNYAFLNGIDADRDGAETGRRIIDTYMDALEEGPNALTLSCIDLGRISQIIPAMDTFFSNVSSTVSADTYSDLSVLRLDSVGFGKASRGAGDGALDLVDLQDLVRKMGKNGNEERLLALLQEAVVYERGTIPGATGLSVYHPFSNKKDYISQWREDYAGLQFSTQYQDYISRFGTILTSQDMADWSGLRPDSIFSESAQRLQFSLQLTEMQQKTFAGSRLMILAAYDLQNGIYGVVGARNDESTVLYAPVSVSSTQLEPDGRLTAEFNTQTLYATDENGKPICGPLSYELSDDGLTCYVYGRYSDRSGRENSAEELPVCFSFQAAPPGEALKASGIMGYDPASETYTPRVPVKEEEYTVLSFVTQAGLMPSDVERMPGFDEWEHSESDRGQSVDLPVSWQLRFFDTQMSAAQLYAVFQITDTQQNTHSSLPVLITNPNLESVQIQPRVTETENYRVRFFLIRDASPLDPGLNLAVEVTNLSKWPTNYLFDQVVINKVQSILSQDNSFISIAGLSPGRTRTEIIHLDGVALSNLESLDEISLMLHLSSENHQYSKDTQKVRFRMNQCDLEGIAKKSENVLGRKTEGGLTWELVRLERNRPEFFDAVLRITNESEETQSMNLLCAANNLLFDQETLGFRIHPGTAGYISFRIPDQCFLNKAFLAGGKTIQYTLNAPDLLERHGETALQSIRLIPVSENGRTKSITISLEPPVRLEEAGTNDHAGELLLAGRAEGYLERVFLADNGLGMRILFVNPTDQDLRISCERITINGHHMTDPEMDNAWIVPARGKAVHCLGVTDEQALWDEERIERAELVFRINEYCATEAVLHFPRSEGQHRYHPADSFDIVPGTWEPMELQFLTDSGMEHFHYSIRAAGGVANGRGNYGGTAAEGETTYLFFTAEITNLFYSPREFSFSNLRINGERLTDRHWETVSLRSGETKTVKAYIPAIQLQDIGEIQEISCEMVSYTEDNLLYNSTVPLNFTIEKTSLSRILPDQMPPLAVAEGDGAEWQLLGLREDEAGSLFLWIRMINKLPDQDFDPSFTLLLNGCRVAQEEIPLLAPGEDMILEIRSENRLSVPNRSVSVYRKNTDFLLEDHALERRGIGDVSDIRIRWQDHGNSGEIVLNPEQSVQLAETEAIPDEERLCILESPVKILVNYVLVGENNAAVSIDLVNPSDASVRLNAVLPAINGEACTFGGEYAYEMSPHSRLTDTLVLIRDEQTSLMVAGDSVQDISFTWNCLDSTGIPESLTELFASAPRQFHSYSTSFTLLHEAPFGAEGGRVLAGKALQTGVNKAELLASGETALEADSATAVKLIPALDDKKTAAFANGEAIVYLRTESAYRNRVVEENGDGYDEWLPVLHRICTTELARDSEGRIVSNYSGLAWTNAQGQVLMDIELSELNPEFSGPAVNEIYEALGKEKGLCIEKRLPAWVFLDRTAYWKYRAGKGSSNGPRNDYMLLSHTWVELSGREPELIGQSHVACNNAYTEIVDLSTRESGEMSCIQMQDEIALKNGETLQTQSEGIQIVRMGDLRLVRADQLEGTLVVCYNIQYQDGNRESFFETYPYGF